LSACAAQVWEAFVDVSCAYKKILAKNTACVRGPSLPALVQNACVNGRWTWYRNMRERERKKETKCVCECERSTTSGVKALLCILYLVNRVKSKQATGPINCVGCSFSVQTKERKKNRREREWLRGRGEISVGRRREELEGDQPVIACVCVSTTKWTNVLIHFFLATSWCRCCEHSIRKKLFIVVFWESNADDVTVMTVVWRIHVTKNIFRSVFVTKKVLFFAGTLQGWGFLYLPRVTLCNRRCYCSLVCSRCEFSNLWYSVFSESSLTHTLLKMPRCKLWQFFIISSKKLADFFAFQGKAEKILIEKSNRCQRSPRRRWPA
jgi:hypothetical protein